MVSTRQTGKTTHIMGDVYRRLIEKRMLNTSAKYKTQLFLNYIFLTRQIHTSVKRNIRFEPRQI